MTDQATVKVYRSAHLFGCFRKLALFIDNKQIGTVASGKEEQLIISPGHHVIDMGPGLFKPKSIEFDISAGGTKDFECGINSKYTMRIIVGILLIVALIYFVAYANFASFWLRFGIAILIYSINVYRNIRLNKERPAYYLVEK